ncbi:MAG: ABC transporter ATP-binding protein, partial [Bacteroidales bacterium]
ITKEYNITTVINTHDMNSVMGIGESITFINQGEVEWIGDKEKILNTNNKVLNDFVFASDLFQKVREVAVAEEEAESYGSILSR